MTFASFPFGDAAPWVRLKAAISLRSAEYLPNEVGMRAAFRFSAEEFLVCVGGLRRDWRVSEWTVGACVCTTTGQACLVRVYSRE